MKHSTSVSQTQNVSITIQTLRENAAEFNRVADHLEATQKFMNGGHSIIGISSGPRLVKRKMSALARKKISLAQKARHAQKPAVTGKAAA